MTIKILALTTNTSQLGYSCAAAFKALLLLFTSPIDQSFLSLTAGISDRTLSTSLELLFRAHP